MTSAATERNFSTYSSNVIHVYVHKTIKQMKSDINFRFSQDAFLKY